MADLDTGETAPTLERLERLIATLAATAEALGCAAELEDARRLAADPGAARQRRVAAREGVEGLVRWLTVEFAGSSLS